MTDEYYLRKRETKYTTVCANEWRRGDIYLYRVRDKLYKDSVYNRSITNTITINLKGYSNIMISWNKSIKHINNNTQLPPSEFNMS